MYDFIDVIETSEGIILPSEALRINGEYIENIISGYRTLNVTGREALSPEVDTYTTGDSDGSRIQSRRFPERIITVTYQLVAESNEAFREAYNKLGAILNVEDAELIFNDEEDKFFIGTPCMIGNVKAGVNSVVGEFEILCADPFKYSVVEYEAVPNLDESSILIDYGGTYKAHPTLEAEFFNEDEGEGDLTGSGDCGYVAFFTEDEKIIQLGDPDETDTETYAKSQTLVNQKFNYETAWGSVAETNWALNNGKLPWHYQELKQTGNVGIAVGYYEKIAAPSTSGTLLTKTVKTVKPFVEYKVSAETSSRTADSVKVKVTIRTTIAPGSTTSATKISAGAKVQLSKTNLYANTTTTSVANVLSGTYYLWDSSVVNGRIRITNASSRVGKSGQVTGWVKVSDIGASSSSASTKGYGLRGYVKFGGGDWSYAEIKYERSNWEYNTVHETSVTVTVKDIEADTTKLEDIKFKVERTDEIDDKVGILEEVACKDLEISTYTEPVPDSWYLSPETYGSGTFWHGPTITRTIPADASGEVGAKNFTFSYNQKMCVSKGDSGSREMGVFMAILVSGSGSNRKVVAGVDIRKSGTAPSGTIRLYVGGKEYQITNVDLSFHNKYFGQNYAAKGIKSVKTTTITKTGGKIEFNVGGIKKTYIDNALADVAVNEITFYIAGHSTAPHLAHNGLYWAKFVKNNCDTWNDIPNKFSSNDIVTADCRSGEVYLNDTLTPSLGALGNDWEDFILTPGLNQIGFSYSDWVEADYAPQFKVRYREVFL